ncbi:hypothetical protein J14TS5_19450 [Paenibacillus lautus]|uniref:hypothetical protein n=1 Tax=Paenibacillus lautus TaxID=1401 RepID=UPI001B19D76A|nr:hypothetical protein [Paenibacillus lautus]GIO96859.1 hypothetical protein J14TS5_19450 [Paenibacillus lautus]
MRQEEQDTSSQERSEPRDQDNHRHGGRHGRRREEGHGGREGGKMAQTFRRGRALSFLDNLVVKRETLKKQVNDPDFEAIREVVSGELKAVDQIIQEYIQAFELYDTKPSQDSP